MTAKTKSGEDSGEDGRKRRTKFWVTGCLEMSGKWSGVLWIIWELSGNFIVTEEWSPWWYKDFIVFGASPFICIHHHSEFVSGQNILVAKRPGYVWNVLGVKLQRCERPEITRMTASEQWRCVANASTIRHVGLPRAFDIHPLTEYVSSCFIENRDYLF